MCRSIKTLHNFDPPASADEIRASAVQFVRKIAGCTHPSRANAAAVERAVDRVSAAAAELLDGLVTRAPARNREVEAARARARTARASDRRRARAAPGPSRRGPGRAR